MFKWLAPKQQPTQTQKTWRTGMWVMYQNKIAVLFTIDNPCEIHYTDAMTGETIGTALVPLDALRQARYPEIPANRRMISADKALELGYGP